MDKQIVTETPLAGSAVVRNETGAVVVPAGAPANSETLRGAVDLVTYIRGTTERKLPWLFVSRDAVVRSGSTSAVLVNADLEPAPRIVVGRAMDGPRAAFENHQLHKAAGVLSDYLKKVTGADCPVVGAGEAGSADRGAVRFLVGANGDPSRSFPELARCDGHGFLITLRGKDLHFVGPSGTGTLYAVWFFLMNYADLRLIGPDELGEVYGRMDRLAVPGDLYILNPAPDYLLRIWTGTCGLDPTAWLGDEAATERFQYHHNMYRIYDVERFGETHPEYYPIKAGGRAIPLPSMKAVWQPTFSDPSVVRRAIDYADEAFSAQTDLKSISVTVNDGGGHSEPDLQAPGGLTAAYYGFVNAVARGVKERWPGRFVAFLAYGNVKDPPPFELEDNVMMFLFSYQGNPKEVFDAWQGKVRHYGVYQWLYGYRWVIPNHWPHAIRDYLRWARGIGGMAFKGEGYLAWSHDGPKMWVLNNLLWNVDADVDALLEDYYRHAYGPEAAPAMARYFGRAEAVYERRRTPERYNLADWKPGGYQFEHATPADIEVMGQALREAAQLVRGEANRKRLDLTHRCYRYMEMFWRQYVSYRDLMGLPEDAPPSELAADAAIRLAAQYYQADLERQVERDRSIALFPNYCHPTFPQGHPRGLWARIYPQFRWEGFEERVGALMDAASRKRLQEHDSSEVASFWEETSRRHPALKPYCDQQRLEVLHPGAVLRNLIPEDAFEGTHPADSGESSRRVDAALADGLFYQDLKGEIATVREVFRGGWFVLTPGPRYPGANAVISVEPPGTPGGAGCITVRGRSRMTAIYRPICVPSGRARYRLTFRYRTSAPGQRAVWGIQHYRAREIPFRQQVLSGAVEWQACRQDFTLNFPDSESPDFGLAVGIWEGTGPESQVWFSDLRLEMLAVEGMAGQPRERRQSRSRGIE